MHSSKYIEIKMAVNNNKSLLFPLQLPKVEGQTIINLKIALLCVISIENIQHNICMFASPNTQLYVTDSSLKRSAQLVHIKILNMMSKKNSQLLEFSSLLDHFRMPCKRIDSF